VGDAYCNNKNKKLYEEVKKRIEKIEKELGVEICAELADGAYYVDHHISIYCTKEGFLGNL
jgi:hypothetical protein